MYLLESMYKREKNELTENTYHLPLLYSHSLFDAIGTKSIACELIVIIRSTSLSEDIPIASMKISALYMSLNFHLTRPGSFNQASLQGSECSLINFNNAPVERCTLHYAFI